MTSTFVAYSSGLLAFALANISLIILQILSDRSSTTSTPDKYTKILIYAVYISGSCCGFIGFSLHLSVNAIWCELIGLTPCFMFLGASKAFVYLFFLRRAKLAQGMITNSCTRVFFKYIGPTYLFFYWIVYSVLSKLVFSGKYVSSENDVSFCLFDEWSLWFPALAGCVDVVNSLFSLSLFAYPLIRAIQELKITNALGQTATMECKGHKLGFVALLKWNVFLSTIASISSILTLFMIAVANEYVWLFCVGDPAVNGLCVFFMLASNRQFIAPKKHKKTSIPSILSRIRIQSLSNNKEMKDGKQTKINSGFSSSNTAKSVQLSNCDSNQSNQSNQTVSIDIIYDQNQNK